MRCVAYARELVIFSIAAVIGTCPITSPAQTPSTEPAPSPSKGAAQPFPAKPVRYVVTFAAGAAPDIVARLLSDRLTRLWNQQVIVDNRVGVGGVMGTTSVAKAPPDGYTLVQCNVGTSAIAMSLYARLPYDQLRDFAPITRIGVTPNIVVAHPSLPLGSMKELVTYAQANPGKLSYSAGLAGTSPPLTMELLKLTLKFDVVHIPYKSGPQGVTDTIGGQVPLGVYNAPSVVPATQNGRLRALGVTSVKRISQLPSAPTMQEAGVPNFEVYSWYGVCAPTGTSTAILDKLHTDISTVLRMPDVLQRFDELVIESTPTSREEFDQFIRAEIARWAHVIKDARIPQQ